MTAPQPDDAEALYARVAEVLHLNATYSGFALLKPLVARCRDLEAGARESEDISINNYERYLTQIQKLETENAALRADKARLDWEEIHHGILPPLWKGLTGWYAHGDRLDYGPFTTRREAIDAAMAEGT